MIARNKEIQKYLYGDNNQELVKTYPFDISVEDTVTCEIRIHTPSINFINAQNIQKVAVYFDVIVANSLWEKDGKLRPYQIITELLSIFEEDVDKDFLSVGRLSFSKTNHIVVNSQYQMVRLVSNMDMFSDKS